MEKLTHDLTKEIIFRPSDIETFDRKTKYFESIGNILTDHDIDYKKYDFDREHKLTNVTLYMKNDIEISTQISISGKPTIKQIGPDTFFTTITYKLLNTNNDSILNKINCRTISVVVQTDHKYGEYKFMTSVSDQNVERITMTFVGKAMLKKENIVL